MEQSSSDFTTVMTAISDWSFGFLTFAGVLMIVVAGLGYVSGMARPRRDYDQSPYLDD